MPVMMMLEMLVAAFGYAFNPVIFPFWPSVVCACGRRRRGERAADECVLYVTSALITLAFAEIGKASFATTRPLQESDGRNDDDCDGDDADRGRDVRRRRRYGALVGSLKSKHSFPSGDCAQAMNLCMILCRYVPDVVVPSSPTIASTATVVLDDEYGRGDAWWWWSSLGRDAFLFGIFLPGVAFARVYYRCHWIEDCLGGILMSWALHNTVIPIVAGEIPTWIDSLVRLAENHAFLWR
jgi:hypothetical protein